jgi:thiol:disulfide interchange protein DsbC
METKMDPLSTTLKKSALVLIGLCLLMALLAWRAAENAPLEQAATQQTKRALPDDLAYIYAPGGEVKRTLTVFTDPTCKFCNKLHQEVPALNEAGIKVRYLMFPRAGIESPVAQHLEGAWCAEDRNAALDRLFDMPMAELNQFPAESKPENCETPLSLHYGLAASNHINATPALITDDGRLLLGYMPAEEIIQLLGL